METIIILSIIVPVARMAGKLQNLHQWLLDAQMYDIEIILVHDKQDPQTSIELIQMLDALNNPKVRLIEKTVNSPGLARNIGIEAAIGRWIQFVDSDDLVDLKSVIESIGEAENKKLEIVSGRFKRVFLGFQKMQDSPAWGSNTMENLKMVFVDPGLWRFTFRTERVKGKRFRSLHLAEDILYLYELELESEQILFSPRIHYSYFTGDPDQLSMKSSKAQDAIEALRIMILSSCKCNRDLKAIIHMRIVLGLIKRKKLNALKKTIALCAIAISKNPRILVSYISSIIYISKYARSSQSNSILGD